MSDEAKLNDRAEDARCHFFKGALILSVAGVVVKLIGSVNWILLSWVLGGEGIGIYQIAFPLYLLALCLSDAGIPVAVSILTAEKAALKDYAGAARIFKLSFLLMAVTGLLLSLLFYFGAGWLIDLKIIREPRAYYSIVALAPAIFLVSLISSLRGYLQGWQMMTPTAVSQIVEQLLRVVTMLALAYYLLPRGLAFAAGGASLGAAVGALAALAVLVWYYGCLQRSLPPQAAVQQMGPGRERNGAIMKRIGMLALPVALSSLMLPVVANLDLFIVPLRLEVAGFSVSQATERFGYLTGMAVPLVNLATIVTASLAVSLVPAISQSKALDDNPTILQRTGLAMRLACFTTIPLAVMLAVLAEPVVEVLYRAPGAAAVTRIMAGSIFLLGLHQVSTGVLQGLGRTSIPLITMGLAAALKVVLNWLLTAMPALGIQGAAIATLADIGLAAVLNLFFIYRHTGYVFCFADLLKNCGAALILAAILYLGYPPLQQLLGNRFFAMAIISAFGGLIYVGAMLCCGGLTRQDMERLPFIGPRLAKSTGE